MRAMNVLRSAGLAIALTAGLVSAGEAQVSPRQFQLTPFGGMLWVDESSALKDAASFGVEAIYYVNDWIGIGLGGSYTRTKTDGTFFPPLKTNLGESIDTTIVISQDLSILSYGIVAKLGIGIGRLNPYIAGGVGGYGMYLDPQSNDGLVFIHDLAFEVGGGLHFRISDRAGVRLNARDIIFTGYDRDRLNPVNPFFWGDFDPSTVPAKESTVHNIRVDFGFSYVPSRP